jgi:hypothetical protein
MRHAYLGLLLAARAAAWASNFADTTLNVSQIASSLPETAAVYLGSPSLVRLPSGALLASHDVFGAGTARGQRTAFVRVSHDGGQSWAGAAPGGAQAVVEGMYWATLFTRAADAPGTVYLLGVSNEGNGAAPAQVAIARSGDGGATWLPSPAAQLTAGATSFSTGPTPVVLAGGRLWRALERNTAPGWASGYAACVVSARADAPDLLDARAWTLSGELPFSSVLPLVPAAWGAPGVRSTWGWLEGGAVDDGGGGGGVAVLLRVNSAPAANKAALLRLAAPNATPVFETWVDPFPGGMSKFTVRRDNASGLFVALANNVSDASVSLPPSCAALPAPAGPLPCCGFISACNDAPPSCLWCHAAARNVLTLSVSAALGSGWRVVKTVLADDGGLPPFFSELLVGFQYVDWQFDGAAGENIVYAARASYRGANNYHNANRHLFGVIEDWRRAAGAAGA